MRKIIQLLLVFICLSFQFVFSQDTLYLYTKQDCSVCLQTKQVLKSRHISFVEFDLSNNENASKMINRLSNSNYKGSIHLPVIYFGNKLLHPAFESNKGLTVIEINAIMDSIAIKQKAGGIAYLNNQNASEINNSNKLNNASDCEHNVSIIYLVVANYSTAKEAEKAVSTLKNFGYQNAGYFIDKKLNSVYVDFFNTYESASKQLIEQKLRFTDAYLIQKSE